jgi:transcription antitermination factor NusG
MAEIVNTAVIRPFDAHLATGPCVDDLELRWFAAYTCANHEKKVREQLDQRSVESFLPLYETVRRWKDRRMCLQLPLFAGYVFVRMAMVDRLRVLQVPSIVRIVGFNGHLAALPDAFPDHRPPRSCNQGSASGVARRRGAKKKQDSVRRFGGIDHAVNSGRDERV